MQLFFLFCPPESVTLDVQVWLKFYDHKCCVGQDEARSRRNKKKKNTARKGAVEASLFGGASSRFPPTPRRRSIVLP